MEYLTIGNTPVMTIEEMADSEEIGYHILCSLKAIRYNIDLSGTDIDLGKYMIREMYDITQILIELGY